MKCIGMNQFKYPEANKKPEITPQRCPTKLTPGIRTDINMRYVKAYHFLGNENNPNKDTNILPTNTIKRHHIKHNM